MEDEALFYEQRADRANYIKTYKVIETAQSHGPRFLHFHDSVEIAYVVDGELLLSINNQEKVLKKGELAFIASFMPHEYKFIGNSVRYVAVIGSQYFSTDGEMKDKKYPAFLPCSENSEKIEHLFDCFYWDDGWGLPNANELLKHGFANTLLGLMKQVYPLIDGKKSHSTMQLVEAMQYINGHCKEPITLASIAARYGYSPSYFSNLFNQFVGMNFRSYLNRCRIAAAIKMMRQDKGIPIYRVAESCGFESLNTFYRAYAKHGAPE